jgi:hypothetical protein
MHKTFSRSKPPTHQPLSHKKRKLSAKITTTPHLSLAQPAHSSPHSLKSVSLKPTRFQQNSKISINLKKPHSQFSTSAFTHSSENFNPDGDDNDISGPSYLLKYSTADQVYPDYYISSRPNLSPTIPYYIDPAFQPLLKDCIPNIPRVGSNEERYDDEILFENLVKFVKNELNAEIHPHIGVEDFDITSTSINDYSTPGLAMKSALEAKKQNWGLVAKVDFEPGEVIMKVPYTAYLNPTISLIPTPNLSRLVQQGLIPECSVEHVNDLNWMIEALRLVLGTVTQEDDGLHQPHLYTASFALGLMGNRILGPAGAYFDVIQALPEHDSSPVAIMNNPNSIYSSAIAPRTTRIAETVLDSWTSFSKLTGGDLLSIYAKVIRKYPKILPNNQNMVLRLREMVNVPLLDILCSVSLPFEPMISQEMLSGYFEWAFFTVATRNFSQQVDVTQLVHGDVDNEMNELKKIDPTNSIPVPIDYMNQSHTPNCDIVYSQNDPKFGILLREKLHATGGKLSQNDISELQKITPSISIKTNRKINTGDQLTIAYSKLEPLSPPHITPFMEDKIEDILTSSYSMTELFETSLSRVPHAMHYLREGSFPKELTHTGPAIYGYYPSFHANDEILLIRPALNQGRFLLPCYDYLATNFETKKWEHKLVLTRNIQLYYDYEYAEPVIKNDSYLPAFSYQDAPLKYILPTTHENFDPNFRLNQKYRKVLQLLTQSLIHDSRGNPSPFLKSLKLHWYGPSQELDVLARVYAVPGFYAPDPDKFHKNRARDLGLKITDENSNIGKNDQKNQSTQNGQISSPSQRLPPFTPAQSREYIIKRMDKRANDVLDQVEKKMRAKYNLGDGVELEIEHWYEAFSEPIDEENEYGKLIQYQMLLQHYMDYLTSPISMLDDGDDENDQNNQHHNSSNFKSQNAPQDDPNQTQTLPRQLHKIQSTIPALRTEEPQRFIPRRSHSPPISTAPTESSPELPPDDLQFDEETAPPRSIKDLVQDYYTCVLNKNFDGAMTSLYMYHQLTLVSHANKVLATRLGLIDLHHKFGTDQGTDQGIDNNGKNSLGDGDVWGKNDKKNGPNGPNKEKHPVLIPFWYRADGYFDSPEDITPSSQVIELPNAQFVDGRVKL